MLATDPVPASAGRHDDGPDVAAPRSPSRRRAVIGGAAAVSVAVLVIAIAVVTVHHSSGAEVGPVATLQPFSLPAVSPSAPPVKLGAAPGRPTVVTFLAAWCDPCRAELPLVEAASRAEGAPAVVGIDVLDQRPDALTLLKNAGVTFPTAYDRDGSTSARWGVVGLPVTVFATADGRIVDYHRGELRTADLTRLIGRLLHAR